jgi:putative peptidoglycan lipid II flippase
VLIPLLSQTQASHGSEASHAAASEIGVGVLVTSLLFGGLLIAMAGVLIPPLYHSLGPEAVNLVIPLTRIFAWVVPANCLTAFLMAVHNWRGRFAIPAIAGVLGPLTTLAIILLAGSSLTIHRVALAVVLGATVNALFQFPSLIAVFRWRPSSVARSRLAVLLLPVLVGSLYSKIDPLIDRPLGAGFDQGTIACMANSGRIIAAAVALSVGGLSVAAFPRLAKAAQQGGAALGGEVSHTLRVLTVILVPLTAALAIFAPQIVHDLFERGRFTPSDTARVAYFLRCSLGILVGGCLGELTSRSFYAAHDMKRPTLIGMAFFTVALILKFVLSGFLGAGGILIATSIGLIGSGAAQLAVLLSRFGRGLILGVSRRLVTVTIATAAALAAGVLVVKSGARYPGVLGGLAGLGVYAGIVTWLIKREPRWSHLSTAAPMPPAD